MPDDPFNEDYFLRGKETGVSLYANYRWMPELTIPMVTAICRHLEVNDPKTTILDFGCARGYVVKAFRELGYEAFGVDVSQWAIENCDPAVRMYVRSATNLVGYGYDWIVAKDVLEHVAQVKDTIDILMDRARVGLFVVVPLGWDDMEQQYVIPDYEKDVTHIHRLALHTWAKMCIRPGWAVTAQYRVPGVKDNYYKPGWEMGNGFITCRRIAE